jgi:hypothetical protein
VSGEQATVALAKNYSIRCGKCGAVIYAINGPEEYKPEELRKATENHDRDCSGGA